MLIFSKKTKNRYCAWKRSIFRHYCERMRTNEKGTFDWLIRCYNTGFDKDFKYSFSINLKENGKHIGWCGVGGLEYNYSDREIYYLIGRDYWNKGYASEAVSALIDYCFNTIGLERIAAKVDTNNFASKRIIDKMGFRFEYIISGLPEKYDHCNGELYHSLTKDEYIKKLNN